MSANAPVVAQAQAQPMHAATPGQLVAPPVMVVMVGAPTAYVRPQGEPPAAQAYYGKWSAGTCGCCFDPLYSLFFFCCFPCALVLRVSSIIDKVGGMHLPVLGLVSSSNAFFWGLVALALCLVPGGQFF